LAPRQLLMAALARVCKVAARFDGLITGETAREGTRRASDSRGRGVPHEVRRGQLRDNSPPRLNFNRALGQEKARSLGPVRKRLGRSSWRTAARASDEVGRTVVRTRGRCLRVRQRREIRARGGRERIRVDVRVIAATNRILTAAGGGRTFAGSVYRLDFFSLESLRCGAAIRHPCWLSTSWVVRRGPGRIPTSEQRTLGLSAVLSLAGNVRDLQN